MSTKDTLISLCNRAEREMETAERKYQSAFSDFEKAKSYWYGLKDAVQTIEEGEKLATQAETTRGSDEG